MEGPGIYIYMHIHICLPLLLRHALFILSGVVRVVPSSGTPDFLGGDVGAHPSKPLWSPAKVDAAKYGTIMNNQNSKQYKNNAPSSSIF